MMVNKARVAAAALSISAAAGGAWMAAEGFSAGSYVSTQGDVPTIGHGSTHYEDGTRVKMTGPPITRQRAAELALGELERTYANACVTVLVRRRRIRLSLTKQPTSQASMAAPPGAA